MSKAEQLIDDLLEFYGLGRMPVRAPGYRHHGTADGGPGRVDTTNYCRRRKWMDAKPQGGIGSVASTHPDDPPMHQREFVEARKKRSSGMMLDTEKVLTSTSAKKIKGKKATLGPYDFLSKTLSVKGPNGLFWRSSFDDVIKAKNKIPGALLVVGVDEKSPKKVFALANKKRQFFTNGEVEKLLSTKKENFGMAGAPGGVRDDPESPDSYGDYPGNEEVRWRWSPSRSKYVKEFLNETAVSEYEILRHWFDRMFAKRSFDGKFEGWALSYEAQKLMMRRGYIRSVALTNKWERVRGLNPATWRVTGPEVDISDYELTPKGITAARATAT